MLNEQEIKNFFEALGVEARAIKAGPTQWVLTLYRNRHSTESCYGFVIMLEPHEEDTPLRNGWRGILYWLWELRGQPSFATWLSARNSAMNAEELLDSWRACQYELQSFAEIFDLEERAEFFRLMGYKEP